MSHTKAGRRLAELLSPRPPQSGKTQAELAAQLEVTPQAVSGWMHGRGRPSPRIMAILEKDFEIPMRDWLEPAPAEEPAPESGRPSVEPSGSAA